MKGWGEGLGRYLDVQAMGEQLAQTAAVHADALSSGDVVQGISGREIEEVEAADIAAGSSVLVDEGFGEAQQQVFRQEAS